MAQSGVSDISGWTLERHILEEQRAHSAASGEFTRLFQQLALAGKISPAGSIRPGSRTCWA